MRKTLSLLWAMTLGAITSTSVIACGGQKPTPPTSDTRTDIEKEITSTIALGQLDTNTKTDFLDKLQTALVQIPNLSTITPNDYDVYKAGTITSIQDNDIIAGNSLNIKIVAKGNKFKGNKDNITTNYTQKDTRTDIEKEITSTIALGQLDTNTKTDFLDKLQTALVQIPNLSTITPNDYDVYKAGTITSIQDNDIIAGNSLNIKIVAKGNKFKGNKDNITTNYTQKDTRTDIEKEITSTIALGQLDTNTKTDFLDKLQTALVQIPNLSTITPNDYDVYKAGTITSIQDNDIIAGNSLNIKIVAKGNKFKGNKDNITTNYTQKDTKTDIEKEITSTIALGQLDTNTKTDFLDKLQTALVQIPNLSTITPNDYDVYKAGTITFIQDNDIIAGNSLNIKIVAKGNKFKGNKDNITTNYTQKDTKTDLSTITQLTGLDLVANSSKKFSELKITICTTADQFKNRLINPSFSSIAFYDSSTSTNDIKSQNQRSGDFWITIRAARKEPNWNGQTEKIKITIR